VTVPPFAGAVDGKSTASTPVTAKATVRRTVERRTRNPGDTGAPQ